MTWQLWQQQHRQPAPPSRTLVLDKLKSGDDCCCRVCFRMNLQKPSHSERFSFLTKFHSSLSFNDSGWYCWQNNDMPCRPLLLVSLDFLLLFLLDFFHALVKHCTGMILVCIRTLLHDQALAKVLPEIDVWWVKKKWIGSSICCKCSVATAFAKMQRVRNNPDLRDWIRGV